MSKSESYTDTVNFLYDFVLKHPRLSALEEMELVNKFRFAYDTKQELLKDLDLLEQQIPEAKDWKEEYSITKELNQVKDLLKNDPSIKNIEYYRNKLINHNLKLVIKTASAYENVGMDFEDLFQEGILGFIRAIEKYDPSRGVKLGTYSVWWIRQKITRSLSNKSRTIRLPVHIAGKVVAILATVKKHRLDATLEYIDEIHELTKYSKEEIEDVLKYINGFFPINKVASNYDSDEITGYESEEEFYSQGSDVDELTNMEIKENLFLFKQIDEHLNGFFNSLPPKEKLYLCLRLGLGFFHTHTYTSIGTLIGKNQIQNISQEVNKRIDSAMYSFVLQNIVKEEKNK